jgi:S-DNA-T family DNA segregation ATPase FtsK/SpoIIIE
LRWAVAEMNRRYQLCAEYGCRNITDYNVMVAEEKLKAEEKVFEKESLDEALEATADAEADLNFDEAVLGKNDKLKELPQKMPNIVIVIDELADLMMSSGKEVEASICRIAQMARAVGMHLIVATQRPSVDVITGLIKANIPARIAFAVSSSIDSRTILDGIGAEDLLGKGDMLYLPGGMSKPVRIQGIYVSPKEIERVVNNVKVNGEPAYLEDILSLKVASEKVQGIPDSSMGGGNGDDDEMYEQALRVVKESRRASASLLQRRLKVGYARAARLLDLMEQNGAIGPVNGAKPREIYVE